MGRVKSLTNCAFPWGSPAAVAWRPVGRRVRSGRYSCRMFRRRLVSGQSTWNHVMRV